MAEGGIGVTEKVQETAAEETSKTEEVRNQREDEIVLKILAERLNFTWVKASPLDYFCGHGNDGLRLSWARGVNDSSALEEALKGGACILEGDVCRAKHEVYPVMCRQQLKLDVGLEMKLDTWLDKVKHDGRRGVLLNFLGEGIFEKSLQLLRHAHIQGPIILSAEGFEAHLDSQDPIPNRFIFDLCRKYFPKAILSLELTGNISDSISENTKYSNFCLNRLTKFLHEVTLTTHVMFSMHALILKRTIEVAQTLLSTFPDTSLYVWTDEDHPVCIDILTIRRSFNKSRVFYNLPKSQLDALQELHADFSRSCYIHD